MVEYQLHGPRSFLRDGIDEKMLRELFKSVSWSLAEFYPGGPLRTLEESFVLASAWNGEQLIGFVRAENALPMCHVGELAVHPGYRRQRVGGTLLSLVERHAHDSGFTHVMLRPCKSSGSEGFYEKRGYRPQSKQWYVKPLDRLSVATMIAVVDKAPVEKYMF